MKKKLVLIIAVAVLIVALLAAGVVVLLRNTGDTVLSMEQKTALAGDYVSLSVNIKNNHGIYYGLVNVSYNADVIEFVSCEGGEVFNECESNDVGGTVIFIVNQSDLSNSHIDGKVATLNFKIKDSAVKGDYDISFDKETAFCNLSEPEDLIIPEFKNGKITVK